MVRVHRNESVHLVTQARRSLSDDISYRQRRYLLMMGIRAICFVIAIVLPPDLGHVPHDRRHLIGVA